ncbi:MAG: MinD/ParA family protein [Campylobacter sp.]|nr:MinD/ParA family protein [Campylobacter sp.]
MNIVSLVSGKGGVGKSAISVNLADTLAREGYKVLLVDADFALGNLDILLNVKSEKSLLSFFNTGVSLSKILVQVRPNLYLLPGYSGDEILNLYSKLKIDEFIRELRALEGFDFAIIDTMSSLQVSTKDMISLSDKVIAITTPEPTSIIDSYAMMKMILNFKIEILHIVNSSSKDISDINQNLEKILKNNTESNFNLNLLGSIRADKKLAQCTGSRELLLDEYPYSLLVHDYRVIASNLLSSFGLKNLKIESIKGVNGAFMRILDLI